ncbi:hypothetical protein HC251_01420 [Iamia sp. SCSIO 61187]|uniref:hypothetical protein n=1 Tax=Iamia sp. SCSIO 61187 TaxID=2722752 RepID=UPI001C6258A0|nr:hypothetical protein [Iamia sp. SCSIO 61187]QYG91226.1 hypothetical protein HC251_01420 [Iamia sp. SCSIO 61187]
MPPKKSATKSKRTMSDEHKQAIAEGRKQAKAVSDYLEALAANKPKRGRQRTPDTIKARIAKIDDELATADAISALNLRQERLDLEAELASKSSGVDISGLESAFVAHAKGYAQRKGISYAVWRDAGVAAAVLKKAGIGRGS